MSNIIKNFGDWHKVFENDVPGRERERGDQNNKVVAIPVDQTTLKLKIVNDADVINAQGQLTISGFDAILNWIKGQREIINYYSALNDLTNNVVIYSVQKDNARKQLVIFKIYSKAQLKTSDPSAKGIDPRVRFIGQNELGSALGGKVLNVAGNLSPVTLDQVSGNTQGQTGLTPIAKADFNLPVKAAAIIGSTDTRLINFITVSYNKIKKDPAVSPQPVMAKVKEEVKAGTLGANTALFVKALNAGFGIMDAQFGEETETDVTQKLYDKIMAIPESKGFYLGLDARRIVEAESTVIKGFDIDMFLAALKTVQVDTGGIKVPPAGFKEGMQNDPELKKFQDILKKKLAKNLANHATYQKFAKAGAKGFQGNYGPLTKDLVYLLKAIAENPPYPNRDGSTIESEFVNLVMGIKESTGSSYLGLDGMTFIYEDFNFGQANVVAPSPGSGGGGGGGRPRGSRPAGDTPSSSSPSGTKYLLQSTADQGYDYLVKDGVWYWRKDGKTSLLTNGASVKALYKKYPNAGGYFIKLEGNTRANKHLYKPVDGVWYVKLSGSSNWEKVNKDDDLQKLKNSYGEVTKTAQKQKESKLASAKEIDETHRSVANTILSWFEDGAFDDYKHTAWNFQGGDDEDGAWKEFKRKWNTGESSIKAKLAKTQNGINNLPGGAAKDRCKRNQNHLENIIKDNGTFYNKFQGGTSDDSFVIKLYQEDGGVYRKPINTDL
jgi:hypothetical protein